MGLIKAAIGSAGGVLADQSAADIAGGDIGLHHTVLERALKPADAADHRFIRGDVRRHFFRKLFL